MTSITKPDAIAALFFRGTESDAYKAACEAAAMAQFDVPFETLGREYQRMIKRRVSSILIAYEATKAESEIEAAKAWSIASRWGTALIVGLTAGMTLSAVYGSMLAPADAIWPEMTLIASCLLATMSAGALISWPKD